MKRNRPMMIGAVAASVSVLAACGGGPTAGSTDSLDLWLPTLGENTDAAAWDPILEGFEQEHDVDVNVRIIPWANYEEAYLTGISGGEGPDVGYMYTEMMGDYLAQDAIVPFGEYLAEADTPEYLYLDQGVVNGEQVAMPFVVGGARVLYYNKDLLAEAGVEQPPSTWEEFLDASEQLQAAGITPLQEPWGGHRGMLNESYFPLLWQAGGELFTEDGSATAFNSPEGLEAAEFLMQLRETGAMSEAVTSLVPEDVESAFVGGETAFLFGADAGYPTFDEGDFELGLVDSLEHETSGTFVASDSLVVLEKCPDKQLCTDLAVYLTSPAQMEQIHEFAPYPPISAEEEYLAAPEFRDVYAQTEMLHNLPIVAGSTAVYNSLFTNLQQMLLGQKTPEQALSDAADEGDRALANAQG
ncbi:sugar ABC transporter substrate-binding protein [Georgenia halophila]|uniref:Sugar ABC transporter substrate-binding protein n=1 Tax=Georgenia halophila TaxID=620889 RepID=A0ABP8L9X1_9MICO